MKMKQKFKTWKEARAFELPLTGETLKMYKGHRHIIVEYEVPDPVSR